MDTTHAIVEVEVEYKALLGDPRRPLSRFVEVSLVYARMLAEPDPDRSLEVFALALETLHDPPAPAEAKMALHLIRSRREVARRLGRHAAELDSIDRERRMREAGFIEDPGGLHTALGRRAAAVRFAEGNVGEGFIELIGCLRDLETTHLLAPSVTDLAGERMLADVATDLILAIRRHRMPSLTAEGLEALAARLRQDHPDGPWTMWSLVILAALRLDVGDVVTAQIYLRRVETVSFESLPLAPLVLAGWVSLAVGDHGRALERFAAATHPGAADERLRLLISAGLGESFVGLGQPDRARAPLAEAISHDVGDPLTLARCHELLAELAANDRRFDEAYEHLLETRRLEDLVRAEQEARGAEHVLDLRSAGRPAPAPAPAVFPPPYVPEAAVQEAGVHEALVPPPFIPEQFAPPSPQPAPQSLVPPPYSPPAFAEDDLVLAGLRNNWFVLHVQAISSNELGRPVAAEALLRLMHPQRGLLTPGEFLAEGTTEGVDLPVTERSGFGGALGDWIIDEACRILRSWDDQGLNLRLSVNISRAQLTPEFVGHVQRCLDRHGVSADSLILEVKERVLTYSSRAELAALDQVQAIGIRVGIDNLGTTASSRDLVAQYPVNLVKIDRSAIAEVGTSRFGRFDIAALVALASTYGVDVVAEGVETAAQLDQQQSLGCRGAQGFLIGRPVPAGTFAELVSGLSLFDRIAAGAQAA